MTGPAYGTLGADSPDERPRGRTWPTVTVVLFVVVSLAALGAAFAYRQSASSERDDADALVTKAAVDRKEVTAAANNTERSRRGLRRLSAIAADSTRRRNDAMEPARQLDAAASAVAAQATAMRSAHQRVLDAAQRNIDDYNAAVDNIQAQITAAEQAEGTFGGAYTAYAQVVD